MTAGVAAGRPWDAWVAGQLDTVRDAGRWRSLRSFDARGPEGTLADGSTVVSFASNDYLGLAGHPAVVAAAHEALDRWGAGATASRLIVGSRPVHHDLEDELAAWRGTEAALVLPSGFAANLSVLTTFGGPDVVVVSDELNHASIIDGCRLSRSRVEVARHADPEHVAALVSAAVVGGNRVVVATDTVFSMDGDVAPVVELADVCRRHGALLVLDEAHSVLGPHLQDGELDGVAAVRVGTLSKALGSMGGFVAASRDVIDLLVNRARPFIFTTGLTPADAGAGLAALRLVRSSEGAALRDRLRAVVDRLAPGHPSPIVPVVLGEEAATMEASAALLADGLLVPGIRPPTVAPGTCRLRVALSAAHTDNDVDRLARGLAALPGALLPGTPLPG